MFLKFCCFSFVDNNHNDSKIDNKIRCIMNLAGLPDKRTCDKDIMVYHQRGCIVVHHKKFHF